MAVTVRVHNPGERHFYSSGKSRSRIPREPSSPGKPRHRGGAPRRAADIHMDVLHPLGAGRYTVTATLDYWRTRSCSSGRPRSAGRFRDPPSCRWRPPTSASRAGRGCCWPTRAAPEISPRSPARPRFRGERRGRGGFPRAVGGAGRRRRGGGHDRSRCGAWPIRTTARRSWALRRSGPARAEACARSIGFRAQLSHQAMGLGARTRCSGSSKAASSTRTATPWAWRRWASTGTEPRSCGRCVWAGRRQRLEASVIDAEPISLWRG